MPAPTSLYNPLHIVLVLLFSILLGSCQKQFTIDGSIVPAAPVETGFKDYFIPKGGSYSTDSTTIEPLNGITEMKLKFRFDSSAIYTTVDPQNQSDINKLYGFADCVSFTTRYTIAPHHISSARFGWSWYNNALRIYAYYYNDSVRQYRELRTVEIGKTYTAGIRLVPKGYEFSIENKKDTVLRSCPLAAISGYKLFPFFGGTELSPQNIHIWIKEL